MFDRRMFLFALTGALALATPSRATRESARSSRRTPSRPRKRRAGRLVEITAPWCPVCRAQKPILSELTAAPQFKNLAVFEVDFDSRKDVVRAFGAQTQSTLIAFKGAKEVGRSVGDTNARSIEDLLDRAI